MKITFDGSVWTGEKLGNWEEFGGPSGEYALHPDDASAECTADGKLMFIYASDMTTGLDANTAIGLLLNGDPDNEDHYFDTVGSHYDLYRLHREEPAEPKFLEFPI